MRLTDNRRPYAASCGILDEITTGNTHSTLEIIDVTSNNVLFGIFNHNMLIFISVTPKLQLQFLRNPLSQRLWRKSKWSIHWPMVLKKRLFLTSSLFSSKLCHFNVTMRCLNLFVQNIFQMNSKSLKIRIKISIQPWMKIIFLIVAYFIGQQNAYKEKYKPDEVIMPKVRDLTA